MHQKYDIVIIGSGLGGLMSGLILAKEGKRVAIIEKNSQFGGNLQTFVRNRTLFDTGVHYVGSLESGQTLYNYFSYAGIMQQLDLERMPIEGYDHICFGKEVIEYPHAQGYENFVEQLSFYFPKEHNAIEQYITKIQEVCNCFPLYRFHLDGSYDEHLLSEPLTDFLSMITSDKRLQAVLLGNNFLYAGTRAYTPLYLHALSVNSYIESAWRLKKGGSQITYLLLQQLEKLGVSLFKENEALAFEYRNEKVYSVITSQQKKYIADHFISDIDIKQLVRLVGKEYFKPSYFNRIERLTPVTSVFSLYLVLKSDTFPYIPYNVYWFKDTQSVWGSPYYTENDFPSFYTLSMNPSKNREGYADNMTIMTYMNEKEVNQWIHTSNMVSQPQDRGEEYEVFKKEKTEQLLKIVEGKFPQIRNSIAYMYTSTPLTYRDYIGSPTGALYGYEKNAYKILHSRIIPQTHIPNLYVTGQTVNMHGLVGVTIGAVLTCMALLKKKINGIG
ncbi:NAD(P)/FAD-dependent oxidoreductase [Capnocytophaga sp. oral taxon 338]|uniref:phytoene desaturase family protein n=1 Tax=Capnocytophaga sp. oral taxon 338 TaxID=710239 RepID=UPI000202D184|nr:NAD(P)-binding protein [Capnocytophaga sp. oral taxon 338]EGD33821.1 all-trans-retinol 13,14-reductase [Capnocytophaga sp. oral taxon 338 str. F0234]